MIAHFERRITFGQDADFSHGVKAKFDGKTLQIEGEINTIYILATFGGLICFSLHSRSPSPSTYLPCIQRTRQSPPLGAEPSIPFHASSIILFWYSGQDDDPAEPYRCHLVTFHIARSTEHRATVSLYQSPAATLAVLRSLFGVTLGATSRSYHRLL